MCLATGKCVGQCAWPDKKVALWPPVKSHCALTTLHFWMWSQTWKMVRRPEGMQMKQLLKFRDLLFLDTEMFSRHCVRNVLRINKLLCCEVNWCIIWDIFSWEAKNWKFDAWVPFGAISATFPVREEPELENQQGSSFESSQADCNRYELLNACLSLLLMSRGLSLLPTATLSSILTVVMPH